MPRRDRTFTDTDVLRIINRNLDSVERERLLRVLVGDVPEEEPPPEEENVPQLILEAIFLLLPPIETALGFAQLIESEFGQHPLIEQNIRFAEESNRLLQETILLAQQFT